MAEELLPLGRQRAGADCLAALRRIGLDPEKLLWVLSADRPGWILVLATGLYEAAGPLGLSKLLFDAHNAGLLPDGIDPFDFEVWSPEQALDVFGAAKDDAGDPIGTPLDGSRPRVYRIDDFVIPSAGIYAWDPDRRTTPSEREQTWRRLARTIHSRAA